MSMRRNDFKAIAEVLRKYHTSGSIDKSVLREMINELCVHFRHSNDTFDKGRFIKACGYYQE